MITHSEPVHKRILCMKNSCARNCVVEGKMMPKKKKSKCLESSPKQSLTFSSLYKGEKCCSSERSIYLRVFEKLRLEHTT